MLAQHIVELVDGVIFALALQVRFHRFDTVHRSMLDIGVGKPTNRPLIERIGAMTSREVEPHVLASTRFASRPRHLGGFGQ